MRNRWLEAPVVILIWNWMILDERLIFVQTCLSKDLQCCRMIDDFGTFEVAMRFVEIERSGGPWRWEWGNFSMQSPDKLCKHGSNSSCRRNYIDGLLLFNPGEHQNAEKLGKLQRTRTDAQNLWSAAEAVEDLIVFEIRYADRVGHGIWTFDLQINIYTYIYIYTNKK